LLRIVSRFHLFTFCAAFESGYILPPLNAAHLFSHNQSHEASRGHLLSFI
jgi:hypothetical protein